MSILDGLNFKVIVEEKDLQNNTPARVSKERNGNYLMQVNTKVLDLFGEEERSILKTGLQLHELAHVKYDSFGYKNNKIAYKNVWDTIDNIIEDIRIEYQLSLEYPSVIPYFRTTLKLVDNIPKIDKPDIDLTDEEAQFNQEIYHFFRYARHNEYNEIVDENFITPLLLSAKRGDRRNCSKIVDILYGYYTYILNENETQEQDIEAGDDGYSDLNIDDIEEIANDLIKILDDENARLIPQNNENGENNQQTVQSVIDDDTLNACIANKDFYYQTMKNNLTLILELEKVYKKILNKSIQVPFKEGDIDINPIKQMNAYINSFTQEEGYNYNVTKQIEREADICILRDVSYSTSNFERQYAEITVCLLEALSRFKYIRTSVIDFASGASISKDFTDRLPGIHPYSSGTTNLSYALSLARQKLNWKYKKRYIIILTDGSPDSRSCVDNEIKDNFYKDIEIIPMILFNDMTLFSNDIHINSLNEIPIKLMEVL
jgi:hypothetical protein